MTTPEQALAIARQYVAENRSYCDVAGLLEDAEDYLIELELKPGMQWPVGPGPLFISKATGKVWSDAYPSVMEKIDAMR